MNELTKSQKLDLIATLGIQEGIKAIFKCVRTPEFPEGRTLADVAKDLGTYPSVVSDVIGGSRPKHRVKRLVATELGLTWDEMQAAAEGREAA